MINPADIYPKALVPEFLTELSIEKLPLETPLYIHIDELDEYDVGLFVDSESRLRISKDCQLPPASEETDSPIGKIGIMKTHVIDSEARSLRCAYVADLRFIDNHRLSTMPHNSPDMEEEYMDIIDELNDSIAFDAFVTKNLERRDRRGEPMAAFYGDESFHEALSTLGDQGDRLMNRYLKSQKKAKLAAKATKESMKESAKNEHQPVNRRG